jgi:phycocyanobilin lyase alpha subunit
MNDLSLDETLSDGTFERSPDAPALTIEQAIVNLQGEDRGDRYYAAWWLGRFRINRPDVIEALIATLSDERDRTPDGGYPLRRNAARALGKLGNPQVVPSLIPCLSSPDYYVREAATQSLGQLGDPSAIAPLISLLDGGLTTAQPIPNCPHLAQPYDAILEALGSLGAQSAQPRIVPFLEHPTPVVQYAAARALYQLTGNPTYGDQLIAALKGDKLQLRRAVLADLGAIGYLAAAVPIAETLAENSLKLIALKGLLEHHLRRQSPPAAPSLSPEATAILHLMDDLL